MSTELRTSPRLDPALESMLARLRRRVRAYVWADGLASALVVLGGAFWVSLAFDWLFEPPRPLRVLLLAAIGVAWLFVVFRYLVMRLVVRLRDRNLALLLERRFGDFRDSLLTAVELVEEPAHASDFNPDMLAHVRREAVARAAGVRVGEVFNARPLVRRVTLTAVLLAAIAVFAAAAPSALATWARRSLLMSDELWPRKTRLLVEGFNDRNRVKLARGGDWELAVKADAARGRQIPEIVEVRYTTSEGARGRENMSREGIVEPGQAPFQEYAYTFKSVLAPLEFYVAGGDDRAGPFYLDVVDSPTISRMILDCRFPAYTRRTARAIPVAGLMQLPRGTEIAIRAEANKPLVSVQIDDVAGENAAATHHIPLAAEKGAPQTNFQYGLGRLDGDKTLLFTLADADGIRSREAIRLAISAIADEPPQVNVALKGIGTAITPAARLPAAGEVTDDYGLAKVWFEFQVDEKPAQQRPLVDSAGGKEKLAASGVMEVRDLELAPKQRLHVAIKAADECALAEGANVGATQRYSLEVVTAEQLRSMLEARELTLRRRFETIMAELADTRDLLASIDVKQPPPAEAEAPATPDDPSADDDAPRRRASASVQVERVLQNSERSSHETLQLALAFDDIREEMINNRVDTEELKTRLNAGIADPLKRIVGEPFPKLFDQLKQLSKQLAEPEKAVSAQAAASAQIDAILVEMKQVLDKMLELETFNEVLETLRGIIDSQQKLNDETRRQQKQDLKELIE